MEIKIRLLDNLMSVKSSVYENSRVGNVLFRGENLRPLSPLILPSGLEHIPDVCQHISCRCTFVSYIEYCMTPVPLRYVV